MLPEWTLPYFSENYTGPFLSDGKFQSSVANGRARPKSKLDILSREHDTAYALAKNDADRRKADRVYYRKTRAMSWFPRLAGDLVLYVNDPSQLYNFDIGASGTGSNVVGGGVKMGNSSGRERAQRLRQDSKQVSGKDIKVPVETATIQPVAPIYTGQPVPTPTVYNPTSNGVRSEMAGGEGSLNGFDPNASIVRETYWNEMKGGTKFRSSKADYLRQLKILEQIAALTERPKKMKTKNKRKKKKLNKVYIA